MMQTRQGECSGRNGDREEPVKMEYGEGVEIGMPDIALEVKHIRCPLRNACKVIGGCNAPEHVTFYGENGSAKKVE